MNPKDLRDLSMSELKDKHKKFKEELFNLRFQNAIGQLGNSGRIKDVKKTIARVLTIMKEKEMGLERTGARR